MDSISAIRSEIAELDSRKARLERALAILDPEAIAHAAASAPIKTAPARPKGTPGRKPKDGGPTARQRIIAHLQANPDGCPQSDFYALGVDTAQVAGLMKRMEEKGEVTRSTYSDGTGRTRRFVKLVDTPSEA